MPTSPETLLGRGPVRGFLVENFDSVRAEREDVVRSAATSVFGGENLDVGASDYGHQESNWLREAVFPEIDRADFVVVDSFPPEGSGDSHAKPNIYLELGYAIRAGKPIILIEPQGGGSASDLQGFFGVWLPSGSAWPDRKGPLSEVLPDRLSRLAAWVWRTRLRDRQDLVMPGLRAHIEAMAATPRQSSWKAYLTRGAAGLRVMVPEGPDLPAGLIVEVWGAGDAGSHELIGLAMQWARNPAGRWQGEVVTANATLLERQVARVPPRDGLVDVVLKPWEGQIP